MQKRVRGHFLEAVSVEEIFSCVASSMPCLRMDMRSLWLKQRPGMEKGGSQEQGWKINAGWVLGLITSTRSPSQPTSLFRSFLLPCILSMVFVGIQKKPGQADSCGYRGQHEGPQPEEVRGWQKRKTSTRPTMS